MFQNEAIETNETKKNFPRTFFIYQTKSKKIVQMSLPAHLDLYVFRVGTIPQKNSLFLQIASLQGAIPIFLNFQPQKFIQCSASFEWIKRRNK